MAEGREPDDALLRSIHCRKTGCLIRASVRAGALLAEARAADLEVLTGFATRFGLAFQIADDIKDEILPPEVTGKAQGGDQLAGKMTFPACFGIEASMRLCREEVDASIDVLAGLGVSAELLVHIARDAVAPALMANGS